VSAVRACPGPPPVSRSSLRVDFAAACPRRRTARRTAGPDFRLARRRAHRRRPQQRLSSREPSFGRSAPPGRERRRVWTKSARRTPRNNEPRRKQRPPQHPTRSNTCTDRSATTASLLPNRNPPDGRVPKLAATSPALVARARSSKNAVGEPERSVFPVAALHLSSVVDATAASAPASAAISKERSRLL
jgi:hypothetical protein